jgi:hypothetical protein
MKNSLTLAGIESATFRFVAQHLNHCATAVPRHPQKKTNKVFNINHWFAAGAGFGAFQMTLVQTKGCSKLQYSIKLVNYELERVQK